MAIQKGDENIAEVIVSTLRNYADLIEQRGIVGETSMLQIINGEVDITDQVGDVPYATQALSGQVDISVSFKFADWQALIDRQIKKNQELLGIEPNIEEANP